MGASNKTMKGNKTEGETQLEEDDMEALRQADGQLDNIGENEIGNEERLRQFRAERVLRDQTGRSGIQDGDLQVKFDAMQSENEVLKEQILSLCRRANAERTFDPTTGEEVNLQNDTLHYELQNILQRVTGHTTGQQNTVQCLTDKIFAAEQLARETQYRQLEELQFLTKESTEVMETLAAALNRQHHRGRRLKVKVKVNVDLYSASS